MTIFLLLFLSLASTLQAWVRPEPGKFAIQGEVLWLHASIEDTYYAVEFFAGIGEKGKRYHPEFGFLPAYRLEGAYTFLDDRNDVRLRWTNFSHGVNDSQRRPADQIAIALLPTQLPTSTADLLAGGFGNFASGTVHERYNAVEGLFGHIIFTDCEFHLALQAGLHYASFHNTQSYFYGVDFEGQIPFIAIDYEDSAWGIGPEIGFDFRYLFAPQLYCYCGEFSFVGNLKGFLLAQKNQASMTVFSNLELFDIADFDVHNDANWRVVPGWDIQLGFNYLKSFGCAIFTLEAGYEFINYCKAHDKVRILSQGVNAGIPQGTSIDEYSDFGLHGPYLALSLSY